MKIKGPWELQKIHNWLGENRYPLRVACVGDDGYPRVVSLWFTFRDGKFHCVSHRDSPLVKLLRKAPKVGFEISPNQPPYCGVRGQGDAVLSSDGAADNLLLAIDRYLGDGNQSLATWLLSRVDEEVTITITPSRFFSWDYRSRMDDKETQQAVPAD
ncbi:pyridoxamine 5'-phosphate oxidase family protein [Halioglobus maricola]|uniref:pyridoxamine 5'-phosphate oxidase family protein n=1 Tax=Halioglobus maricola TaxID=2601894 RepID=UPI0014796656|nr:pyridoxamine 5'-phosphate oxidase family protein [Halioglobus maricola]